MPKSYAIVAKMQDQSVKAALNKALADDGRISYDEVKLIIASALDFKSISYQEFEDLQVILNDAKTLDDKSKILISKFLKKFYDSYLKFQQEKKSLKVPYNIDHIPSSLDRRPGTSLVTEYVTIHGTGNPTSTASGERGWLTNPSNTRSASFHIVVDEKEAIECIPLNERAWHAGNGEGNKKSIGIEICESGDRTITFQNAAALAAKILREKGLGIGKLRTHNDWSGKNCPRILLDAARREKPTQTWEWFKGEVKDRL